MSDVRFVIYDLETLLDGKHIHNHFEILPNLLFQSHGGPGFALLTPAFAEADDTMPLSLPNFVAQLANMGVSPMASSRYDSDLFERSEAFRKDLESQLETSKITPAQYNTTQRRTLGGKNFQLNHILKTVGLEDAMDAVMLFDTQSTNIQSAQAMAQSDDGRSDIGLQTCHVQTSTQDYLDTLSTNTGLTAFANSLFSAKPPKRQVAMQAVAALLFFLHKQPNRLSELNLFRLLDALSVEQCKQVSAVLAYENQEGKSFLNRDDCKAYAQMLDHLLAQKVALADLEESVTLSTAYHDAFCDSDQKQALQSYILEQTRLAFEHHFADDPLLPTYRAALYQQHFAVNEFRAAKSSTFEHAADKIQQADEWLQGEKQARLRQVFTLSQQSPDAVRAIVAGQAIVNRALATVGDDSPYKTEPDALRAADRDQSVRLARCGIDGSALWAEKAVRQHADYDSWDWTPVAERVLLSSSPRANATRLPSSQFKVNDFLGSVYKDVSKIPSNRIKTFLFGRVTGHAHDEVMPYFEGIVGQAWTCSIVKKDSSPGSRLTHYELNISPSKPARGQKPLKLSLSHMNEAQDALSALEFDDVLDELFDGLEQGDTILLQDSDGKGPAAVIALGIQLYQEPDLFHGTTEEVNDRIFQCLDKLRTERPGAIKSVFQLWAAIKLSLALHQKKLQHEQAKRHENTPEAYVLQQANAAASAKPSTASQFYALLITTAYPAVYSPAADFYLTCYRGKLEKEVETALLSCYIMSYLLHTNSDNEAALAQLRDKLAVVKQRQAQSTGQVAYRGIVNFQRIQRSYKQTSRSLLESQDPAKMVRLLQSQMALYEANIFQASDAKVLLLDGIIDIAQQTLTQAKTLDQVAEIRELLAGLRHIVDLNPALKGYVSRIDELQALKPEQDSALAFAEVIEGRNTASASAQERDVVKHRFFQPAPPAALPTAEQVAADYLTQTADQDLVF